MGQSSLPHPLAIVVEDDPFQREMIAVLLEESDFDVVQFDAAERAEIALAENDAALLVTDINLVGPMNGVELAHAAKRLHPDMRVIVVSGRSKPALPDDVTFFAKPIYPIELLREAARTLHKI